MIKFLLKELMEYGLGMKEPGRTIHKSPLDIQGFSSIKLNLNWFFHNDL